MNHPSHPSHSSHRSHWLPLLMLALAFALCAPAGASTRMVLTLTVTNNPTTNDTLVFNSTDTRYCIMVVTNALVNWHLTNSALNAKSNLYTHLVGSKPHTTYSIGNLSTNALAIYGPVGSNWTCAASAGWCTLSWDTQTFANASAVVVPYHSVTNLPARTNMAGELVAWINRPGTNTVSKDATSMVEFVSTNGNQTIGGSKLLLAPEIQWPYIYGSERDGTNEIGVLETPAFDWYHDGSHLVFHSNVVIHAEASFVWADPWDDANWYGFSGHRLPTDVMRIAEYTLFSTNRNPDQFVQDTNRIVIKAGASLTNLVRYGTETGPTNTTFPANSTLQTVAGGLKLQDETGVTYAVTPNTTNSIMRGQDVTNAIRNIVESNRLQNVAIFSPKLTGSNYIEAMTRFVEGAYVIAAGVNEVLVGTNVYVRCYGATGIAKLAGLGIVNYTGASTYPSGTIYYLQFESAITNIIANESGLASSSKNRIITGTGADLVMTNQPAFATLIFDVYATSPGRWRVMSHSH